MQIKGNTTLLLVTVALLGLAFGRFLFDNSSEVRELRAKLEELDRTRPKPPGENSKRAWRRGQPGPGTLPYGTSTSSAVDELGLTPEEWALSAERDKRAREGEYFLDSERPAAKKARERMIDEGVALRESQDMTEYPQVFSELGIKPEASAKLTAHVVKIHKASREAEAAIQQVLDARAKYIEQLKTQLSEEDLLRYRQYEETKPALSEYQNFQDFLRDKTNTSIHPNDQEKIKELIREARAYTERSWHGPFEGLPDPGYGQEMVIGQLEQQIREIANQSTELLRKASETGLPEDYKALLAAYYSERIRKKQEDITRIRTATGQHPHR